jgi:hypothetical protein
MRLTQVPDVKEAVKTAKLKLSAAKELAKQYVPHYNETQVPKPKA